MKIAILTQNERVHLSENLIYLIDNLPENIRLTEIYIFETSPFGKKLNLRSKVYEALSIFGFRFVFTYAVRHLFARISRPSITDVCKKRGIKTVKIQDNINNKNNLAAIKSKKYDILISISGNQIFKSQLISTPRIGILNLHTSILPNYRGLMPTFWVLKNGETETGVSVFFVDEGIDTGKIVCQKIHHINERSQNQLIKETKRLGMGAILEALEKINAGDLDLQENLVTDGSYFGFPTKEDVQDFLKRGNQF